MKLHWKSITDENEIWSHLDIDVFDSPNNKLQLHSGGNKRFKLIKEDTTLFWGCIDNDYYGAWLLRNNIEFDKSEMIIPPISSSSVEQYKLLHSNDKISFWPKFFAEALSKSNSSILTNGKWKISYSLLSWKDQKGDLYEKWIVNQTGKAFSSTQPKHLDWGVEGNGNLLSIKDSPREDEGRVKWWRKKVREYCCPPILTWYINSLDAFIILDGHRRLKSFQLEGIAPNIIVINAYREESFPVNEKKQESIIKSLESRQNTSSNKKLNTDDTNRILIDAFDDRPSVRAITQGIALHDFEKKWINEVRAFNDLSGINSDELNSMISN